MPARPITRTRRPNRTVHRVLAAAVVVSVLGLQAVAASSAGATAPAADLSVTLTHTPGSPLTGVPVTFHLTATNAGPGTAQGVVAGFTFTYPFRYVVPPGPSNPVCRVSGEGSSAVCVFGNIAPGQSASASVTLTPYTSGVFVLQAAVSSDTPDPDLADRATTDTVIVQQGPTQLESAVAGMYRLVLGRAPSSKELRFWATSLTSAPYLTRYRVPLAIMSGGESRTRRVRDAYARLLHRPAGSKDVALWSSRLAHGLTVEDFEANLVGSSEFLGRGASPTTKVAKVFQAILGRKATAGDVATWTRRLASGTSSAEMARAVAHTGEGRVRVMNARYRASVHRVANPLEKMQWLANVSRGSTADREWAALLTTSTYVEQFPAVYDNGSCCYAVPVTTPVGGPVSVPPASPTTTTVGAPVP